MIHVLVIPADWKQPIEVREVESGLESFQSLVGGNIEAIALGTFGDHDLWFNEEGKLLHLPFNARASRLFHAGIPGVIDVIVGDAFVSGPVGDEGEATSVHVAVVEFVRRF